MRISSAIMTVVAIACAGAVVGATPASAALPPAPKHVLEGQVVRNDGGPISGLSVTLDGTPWGQTDSQGIWTMVDIPSGPHVLGIERYRPWWGGPDYDFPAQYYPLAATPATATPIDVSGALTRVTFHLETAVVRGRVVDSEGLPLHPQTAQIAFAPRSDPSISLSRGINSDGTFTARVVPGGYALTAGSGDLADTFSTPISLTLGNNQLATAGDLTLPDGGFVAGTITDSLGAPVPSCVTLTFARWYGSPPSGCTDASGAYRIPRLASGNYTGSVTPTDGAHLPTSLNGGNAFSVALGQTTAESAVAPLGGSLDALVTDYLGNPAVGAPVSLRLGGQLVKSATTDTTGHAIIGGLTSAAYTVDFAPGPTTDGVAVLGVAAAVVTGQQISISQQLPESDWVTGTVTNHANGNPIAGLTVTAWRSNCPDSGYFCFYHQAVTDSRGRYRIDGIEPPIPYDDSPRTFTVSVSDTNTWQTWSSGNTSFDSAAGAGHVVDFKMRKTLAPPTCNVQCE